MKYIFLSDLLQFQQSYYIKEIECFLRKLIEEYPKHNEWYARMISSMFVQQDRDIVIALSNEKVVGVSILKKTIYEKKICTLRVDKNFQRNGIGKQLVSRSMEYLETTTPIISVSENKYLEFAKLFKYFGFDLIAEYQNRYKFNTTEYVYNGILLPNSLLLDTDEKDVFYADLEKSSDHSSIVISNC